ncbi:hypothetical protein OROGR_002918 [Orobanche gracilis]
MEYNLSRHGVVTLVALVALFGRPCSSRDLRPSDHGLAYQEDSSPAAPNGDGHGILSFFAAATPSSSVELPEAKNITSTWWSARGVDGEARDSGRDHVRLGLIIASGVCGLTGVVFLAVSGVVFLFRLRKQKLKADRSTSAPATASTHSHAVNGEK